MVKIQIQIFPDIFKFRPLKIYFHQNIFYLDSNRDFV